MKLLNFLSIILSISAKNIDEDVYYRISTLWRGTNMSLDILKVEGFNTPLLSNTENVDSQYWKIEMIEDDYYLITNKSLGEYKALNLEKDSHKLILSNIVHSPTFLFAIKYLGKDLYRINIKFQGDKKSLGILNDKDDNIPILHETGNFSDQMWKLEKLNIPTKPDFYMAFVSDVLFPWINNQEINFKNKKKRDLAANLNENNVNSINELSNAVDNFKGTKINGNLTAFGHGWQLDNFKKIWNKLNKKKYVGLGRQDYSINVDKCTQNSCANRMVNYMLEEIKNLGLKPDFSEKFFFKFPQFITDYNGS